jgi:hypothetical protein
MNLMVCTILQLLFAVKTIYLTNNLNSHHIQQEISETGDASMPLLKKNNCMQPLLKNKTKGFSLQ